MSFKKKRAFVSRSSSGVSRIKTESYGSFKDWAQFGKDLAQARGRLCLCGKPASEVHHIVPLSRGGTTTKANTVYLCSGCHDRRHRHVIPRGDTRQNTFKTKTVAQKRLSRIR